MKAIVTKYFGPSACRGSRVVASDGDGNRVTLDWSNESSNESDTNHLAAVKALCSKMGWHGSLIEGFILKGGVNHSRVWVWCYGKPGPAARRITV